MKKIGITPTEHKIVLDILKDYKNHAIVFGSRIKGNFKKFSDLDICLKTKIYDAELELLQEQLDNSDLPFKVDLITYNRLGDAFKKIIDEHGVLLLEILVS